MVRRGPCALVVAACALVTAWSGEARAQGPAADVDPPHVPAPLILPEPLHDRTDVALTWSVGRGAANAAGRTNAALAFARFFFEGNFIPRRLYGGVTYDFAAALPPDGGPQLDDGTAPARPEGVKTAFGNVEPHVRAVFPLTSELTFGFILGGVIPTASIARNGPAPAAMLAASSMEPTDYIHFVPGHFAVRPALDVRLMQGPFVFQVRDGFDVMIDDAGIQKTRTAGRLLAHAGIAPTSSFEVSIEATQIYFFFTETPTTPPDPSLPADVRAEIERKNAIIERYRISDDHRTAFTIGPSLRLAFDDVELGAAVVTNLGSPLSPVLDSFLAGRLSVLAHFR